jgi:hypothetical protein
MFFPELKPSYSTVSSFALIKPLKLTRALPACTLLYQITQRYAPVDDSYCARLCTREESMACRGYIVSW